MSPSKECKNFVGGRLQGSCATARKYESNHGKEAAANGANGQYERFRCRACPADQEENDP